MLDKIQVCKLLGDVHPSTVSEYTSKGLIARPTKKKIRKTINGKFRFYVKNFWTQEQVDKCIEKLKVREEKRVFTRNTGKDHEPEKSIINLIDSVFR